MVWLRTMVVSSEMARTNISRARLETTKAGEI